LIWRNKKWGLLCLVISGVLGLGLDIAASGLIESRNVNVLYLTFKPSNHWPSVLAFYPSEGSSHCSTWTWTERRCDKR
jgi:hypothetical protein